MSNVDPANNGGGDPGLPRPADAPVNRVPAAAPAAAPARPVAPAAPKPAAPPAPAPAPAPAAAPAAPAVPLENPVAHLAVPFQAVDFQVRGVHADATVAPEQVVEAARLLDQEGYAIDTVTGVDWMAQNQMEVVYDFFHPTKPWRVSFRTRVPRETPEVPTISEVFPGANWHERETHDFFGIRFQGHPDLSPFLLPEDATYHPLRKDFKA